MVTNAQTLAGPTTTWELDPKHTLVEFAAKHMVFTTVKGRFAGVRGTIVEDNDDVTRSTVEVAIETATLDTREEQRDAHLRSPDFLHAEQHPTITFKSTRIEKLGANHLRVLGDLTIRGTTRQVALDTTINGQADTPFGTRISSYTAETSINRKDFGLTWNVALEAGGFLVGDTIRILLEIQAVKQG